ncbi:MAG: AraC family transcriptional regulator [Bacteroidota bacterium]
MKQVIEIRTVSEMHRMGQLPKPLHPLVSVMYNRDLKTVPHVQNVKVINHLYTIIFKSSNICSTFSYGRNSYDHEEGTLVFTGPGQVMEFQNDPSQEDQIDPDGWSLVFHPDIFRKSDLSDKMNKYSFFHYDSNEALHVSDRERISIEDLLEKIVEEYSQTLDRHSQHLIVSNIELFLDYCLRFYDRQFFSRTHLNTDTISKFERFLIQYYESDLAHQRGVPRWFYLFLSSANHSNNWEIDSAVGRSILHLERPFDALDQTHNYLSDLLKKETGKTTLEHIHFFLIERAKNSLLNSSDTISGIAYSLGFAYPQRFSNLFKAKTGMSPKEYRVLN